MDFYLAKANPHQRQDFLNSINLADFGQYVETINYLDQKADYCMDIACHPACKNFLIPGLKSIINVYPFTFENDFIKTGTDLLSVLVDHEIFHAQEYYLNPSIIVPSRKLNKVEKAIFYLNLELRAYQHQLQEIKKGRTVSPEFYQNLESRIVTKEQLKYLLKQEEKYLSIA